ncbi:MAG: biotin--[acetyl-CoA-carboxylase] ligase [Alphaproteobacteria bacterium]
MKIFEFKSVESTQDIALKKDFECAVVTQEQTKGRGRFDRKWESLSGNLFVSIVVKADIADIFKLVMASSVAIREAISCGDIKWPNDVLINSKKASGVLIEKGQEGFYVIGIGINIIKAPKISNLIYPATSLREEGVETTAKVVLEKLLVNIKECLKDENLYNKYKSYLYGISKECKINDVEGTLIDIDKSGFIIVKDKEDNLQKIFAGDLLFKGV